MRLCAFCGTAMTAPGNLCAFHLTLASDDWAMTNRSMCDFIHRGRVPDRPTTQDDDSAVWIEAVEPIQGELLMPAGV